MSPDQEHADQPRPNDRGSCLFIVPASLFDPLDPFTTGVVYMPIGIATAVAAARRSGYSPVVLDLFGSDPKRATVSGERVRLGADDEEAIEAIRSHDPLVVFVYANQLINHDALTLCLRRVRERFPGQELVVCENAQAVTAYQLLSVADELFHAGATALISGDLEEPVVEVLRVCAAGGSLSDASLSGVSTPGRLSPSHRSRSGVDELPVPAWDLFPVENYWSLGYAHGPLTSDRYLPIVTSRGCPFPCKFCVVPSTNSRKWRARSPASVVDEIETLVERFNVKEFHVEDLNPTISDPRMNAIAREIDRRGLEISWKIVAGTKVETIKSLETLRAMHRSGLSYLSMSPESGSPELLKRIGKPFDVAHSISIIRECRRLGVKTQACFVLGFPGETEHDRRLSYNLARKLTRAGLDELVVFIVTPVPGAGIWHEFDGQYSDYSELSFSPRWRGDFKLLMRWRIRMYAMFLAVKFLTHPVSMLGQLGKMVTGHYETKMEMTPIRGVKYMRMARRAKPSRPLALTTR